jgi:mannosyltransferase OCH1-like enzyme
MIVNKRLQILKQINKKNNEIKKINEEINEKKREENKKKREENEVISVYNSLNKIYKLKGIYNCIIPLDLYTCWHTKDLPPLMQQNYNYLVESNPRINFHLYDENDCRNFIRDNFDSDVLDAYNSLIPCSYKSDLWRFCILYKKGGIYLDIKYKCVNNFKFIELTEEEHFVRDRGNGLVYTALIVTLPNNEIMKECINHIVNNVKNKYYGNSPLDPTGPGLLGKFFSNKQINELNMYHEGSYVENKLNEYYIVKNNTIILFNYHGYRDEQSRVQKNKYYSILWDEKNIYY